MPEIYFPNLNIEISKLDRVAFSLFNLEVYWYGVIITLGILAGLGLALHIAKKTDQDGELYMDFLMYAIFFTILFQLFSLLPIALHLLEIKVTHQLILLGSTSLYVVKTLDKLLICAL